MARARNIKPAFFDNDELAEIEPLGRILFIGLWTIADFKGDLEWREKRIKAQLLPYDDCDIKKIAINLDKSGFIRFYSDGKKIYLNVSNFNKHQNPHKNEREKGSVIPAFRESMRQVIDLTSITINRDLSGLNPDENETNRADSLNLIPDSLSLNPETVKKNKENMSVITDAFSFFWDSYPLKRRKNKKGCFEKYKSKCKGMDVNQIEDFTNKIINDLERRLSELEDIKYLPMTEPYLNQNRWEDNE